MPIRLFSNPPSPANWPGLCNQPFWVKKTQCKKASEVSKSNSFQVSQSKLWKLDDNMLINKEGLWMSDEKWKFKTKNDFVYIENISRGKVLETTSRDGQVILKDIEGNKAEQLWKKDILFTGGKETQIILRLFLVVTMYCQASPSQFNQSLNLPRC